ncbi:uncharacterized protein LOC132205777 [Neocloeon triangulifer]|uniref:uncharacterized protein LOC132205777 n=1 Tax=Neocloeon triangulifer TaxID=2078957 RepID=UPI00286EE9E3|nr:uncharacterized protein LOC132205777 [Neocloeon triangulifer]
MKRLVLLCVIAACCTAKISAEEKCVPSVTRSSSVKGNICKGALIFEDNFDFLDLSKWSHEVTMAGGGNWEFQVYWADPANSFTQNGNLNIHPGKLADIYGNDFLYSGTLDLGPTCTQSWNYGCVRTGNSENIINPATSARLHTINTFGFTYGQVEARARIPAGDWIWPAIWMMPRYDVYGGWPTSGEIDIMESRGNRELGSFGGAGVNIGVEQISSTMHWGPDPGHNRYYQTHWERNSAAGNGYNNDFHLYQVEWTPDYIKFAIDNVELGTVAPPPGGFYELGGFANEGIGNPWGGSKMAPFDQEFYLILNVAVGGTNGFFPDGVANPGGKPWVNGSPVAFRDFWENRAQWEPTWQGDTTDMLVDYVRVVCLFLADVDAQCVPSVTRSSTVKGTICKGALIFEDNFNYLDKSKWSHEVTLAGGGNWEFQVYWDKPANSFTSNGNLNIHPGKLADIYGNNFLYSGTMNMNPGCTQDMAWGCSRTGNANNILNPITAARLHTINTFSFAYGKVEVRARLPAGDWLWPAIWMMPRNSVYGGWPTSGEIDIMESRGNRNLRSGNVNIGVEQVGATMHWGPNPNNNRFQQTHWEKNSAQNQGYDRAFHLYQVEWTPNYIKFSVDNVEIGRTTPPAGGFYQMGGFSNNGIANPWASGTKMAPFDQEFYLILNLAVGGTNGYFPDGASNPGGKPWSNGSPTAYKEFWEGRGQWEPTWQGSSTDMLVDYVKVWAL